MKNVLLAGLGGVLVGFAIRGIIADSGKPKIKVLPFSSNPNNGLAVLNFEIDGAKWDSTLSKEGVGSPLGTKGDVTWNVNFDSGKNITVTAYNQKTKKASTAYATLPSGLSLVKTI